MSVQSSFRTGFFTEWMRQRAARAALFIFDVQAEVLGCPGDGGADCLRVADFTGGDFAGFADDNEGGDRVHFEFGAGVGGM